MAKATRHILISRTDGIGDVVLTLPLAGALKLTMPEVKITFLGRGYTQPVADGCKNIDDFANWDAAAVLHPAGQAEFIKNIGADTVIHAFPRKEVVIAASTAGCPIRIGTARRYHTLFHVNHRLWYSRKSSNLHEAALNLRMLSAIGIHPPLDDASLARFTHLEPRDQVPAWAEEFSAHSKTVLLHPLSHGSAVDWPVERFARLAEELVSAGMAVGVTGTEQERQRIGDRMPWNSVTDFCGRLSLGELMALIAQCDGLVAGSTGPLHLAAALGVNALGLYSPQRPIHALRWRPIGPKADFIEAREHPADGHLDITVEAVLGAVMNWHMND